MPFGVCCTAQEMHAHVDLEFVLHLLNLAGALLPELSSEEVLAKMCRKKAKLAVRHTVRMLFHVAPSLDVQRASGSSLQCLCLYWFRVTGPSLFSRHSRVGRTALCVPCVRTHLRANAVVLWCTWIYHCSRVNKLNIRLIFGSKERYTAK